ncbi:MAG: hypothetical protein ACOYBE_07035 [Blautia sp.]|jgi:hypothetical protein
MGKKASGKTLLQVVGIILIILGALSMISGVSSIGLAKSISSGQMSEEMLAIMEAAGPVDAGMYMTAGIITVVESLIYIVFGILGVMFCNRVEKGKLCFILGIILIVMTVCALGYSALQGTMGLTSLLSLILPLLFTWGGYRNMQEGAGADY